MISVRISVTDSSEPCKDNARKITIQFIYYLRNDSMLPISFAIRAAWRRSGTGVVCGSVLSPPRVRA